MTLMLMRHFRPSLLIAFGLVLGLLVGGTTVAIAATSSSTVKVCTTSKGVVRSASSSGACPKKTTKKSINVKGQTGATGKTGATGPAGPGTVDISAYFMGGPAKLAQTSTFEVWGNCNVYGPTFFVQQKNTSTNLRLTGIRSFGDAAPVMIRQNDQPISFFIPYEETIYLDAVVVDVATGTSATLTLSGRRAPSDSQCRYEGQITP